jgi:hypothetical protein
MIIVDFNQVMISNLMMQLGNHTNTPLEEGLLRHMVINSLRSYKQKFSDEYGEMVIACDDKNYWRKQIFPYYKANRKKARDSSELDWSLIFDVFNRIKSEIKEFFPYRVIQVEHAEADDIIATLTENSVGKILILSGDKDFVQLQKHQWVNQYDPIRKKWITCDDPEKYLFNHILKGDAGDGIPNVLSDDDTFVTNKRQRPLTQKRIDTIYNDGVFMLDSIADRNYRRNRDLVDLSCVPSQIKESILSKYDEEKGKGRDKLFNYFIKYKLKHMMENVGDF